mgnify:CR=1 FL=1
MSKVEFQHAQDLRITFFGLVEAGILDYKDKDQPLGNILQKLVKSKENLEAQLEYSF